METAYSSIAGVPLPMDDMFALVKEYKDGKPVLGEITDRFLAPMATNLFIKFPLKYVDPTRTITVAIGQGMKYALEVAEDKDGTPAGRRMFSSITHAMLGAMNQEYRTAKSAALHMSKE